MNALAASPQTATRPIVARSCKRITSRHLAHHAFLSPQAPARPSISSSGASAAARGAIAVLSAPAKTRPTQPLPQSAVCRACAPARASGACRLQGSLNLTILKMAIAAQASLAPSGPPSPSLAQPCPADCSSVAARRYWQCKPSSSPSPAPVGCKASLHAFAAGQLACCRGPASHGLTLARAACRG